MNILNFTSNHFQKITFLFLFLFFGKNALAQTPTIQDCLGAIPICTAVYTENSAPSGAGNYSNEVYGTSQGGICCMDAELNSIWYTFTTNNSGNFGFTLTPNNSNDDYDWAMFDITNGTCADIYNDITMQVSCNASGGNDCHGPTGANGLSTYNNQGAGCDYSPPDQFLGNSPNNAFVPVQQGNTYVLVVSNWTGSTNGYSIDFGVSSNIGIFDDVLPQIAEVEPPGECGGDEYIVTFTENIQCNSISGSNFEVTGPGGPFTTSVSSSTCGQGGEYDKTFTVTVSPPLALAGTYELKLKNESSEVLDLCDNPSIESTHPHEQLKSSLVDLNIGNDTILCEGEMLMLDATIPNGTTYNWQNGTSSTPTFEATQTGVYAVSVSNECNTLTDNIFVEFVSPGIVDVDLGNAPTLCPGESFDLDATWENGIQYIWQDGFSGAIYTVSEPGVYDVQILGACGEMGSAAVEIYFDESELSLDLGVDTLLCEEDGFYILDATHVDALNYEWSDGSTNPNILISESGIYSVTVSDNCKDLLDNIAIDFTNCTICQVFVPNAFSANFDGHNDYFLPYSNCFLENYSLKVFNRWGALVFQSEDPDTGWDGTIKNKDAAEGVYVYLLEFEFNQMGETISKKLSGDVTITK